MLHTAQVTVLRAEADYTNTLNDLFMCKPSSFVGKDQTATDPITVCTFTACQFHKTRVLHLSHMPSFPMGAVPDEGSLAPTR